jgi:hypothetical protein
MASIIGREGEPIVHDARYVYNRKSLRCRQWRRSRVSCGGLASKRHSTDPAGKQAADRDGLLTRAVVGCGRANLDEKRSLGA